jgi:phosphatidylethanolamine N-methyltransferase
VRAASAPAVRPAERAPDIERAYGQRKLLAQRTPLARPASVVSPTSETPSETDGETAPESDALDTETETEDTPAIGLQRPAGPRPKRPSAKRAPLASQHDMLAYYFRKDTIGLRNFDIFR